MTISGPKSARGQILTRLISGAVFGGAATMAFLALSGELGVDFSDPATMLAVMAGLSYGLIGLLVAVGAAAPRSGARFLNVEDADEIREERRNLGPAAAACILAGLFLLILALAPGIAASAGRQTLALLAMGCLAAMVAISLATRGRADELARQISIEASAFTLHVAFVVLGVWATFAHLGYVGWTSPLGLIAGLALLELAAIFWFSAKKGLMTPRQ